MASTLTIPPLSAEDFLYSLARTPTAERFNRRHQQASKPTVPQQVETPRSAQEEPKVQQTATRKSGSRKLNLKHRRRPVEQNIAKNVPASAENLVVQKVPTLSATDCVMKTTLAAITAIQAAHFAGLEALKIRRSSSKTQQAVVLVENDGRFDDPEESEGEEVGKVGNVPEQAAYVAGGKPVSDVPIEAADVTRGKPVSEAVESVQEPIQQPAESTSDAVSVVEPDILDHHREQAQPLGVQLINDEFEHKKDQGVFPNSTRKPSLLTHTSTAAIEPQAIVLQDPLSNPQPFQGPPLTDNVQTVLPEEPLNDLDLELLQLGFEPVNRPLPQSAQRPRSPEQVRDHTEERQPPRSLKRNSPDINDQDDAEELNQENQGSPPKRLKHARERSQTPEADEIVQQTIEEDTEWNANIQLADDDAEDSSYNPRGTIKTKKKSRKRAAKKHEIQHVEFAALDLSPSRRRPFANVDDAFELNEDRDIGDIDPIQSSRSKGMQNGSSSIKKGAKKGKPRKNLRRFSTNFENFRRLAPINESEGRRYRTSTGLPTYSDGFVGNEAKPTGRVMPVSRSRPHAPATTRSVTLPVGELFLTISRSNLVRENVIRTRKSTRKEEARPFRQIQRLDPKPIETRAPEENSARVEEGQNQETEAEVVENLPSESHAEISRDVQPDNADELEAAHEMQPETEAAEEIDAKKVANFQTSNSAPIESISRPPETKLKRSVTFDPNVQYAQVSAPRRARTISETEESDSGSYHLKKDGHGSDEDREDSEEERETDSDNDQRSGSEGNEDNEVDSGDEMKSNQEIEAESENEDEDENIDGAGATSENGVDGGETGDEGDEMLLQPLAPPDSLMIEEDMLSLDSDPMDIDQGAGTGLSEETVGILKRKVSRKNQKRRDSAAQHMLGDISNVRNEDGGEVEVRPEREWRPRRPSSSNQAIEVDEDILHSSSPAHVYGPRPFIGRIPRHREERRDVYLEIPDSQEAEIPFSGLSFVPDNVSNYFSRASQALENDQQLPTGTNSQARNRRVLTRSKSMPRQIPSLPSLNASNFSVDVNENATMGDNGLMSMSQMFRYTLSSQAPVGSSKSQMSFTPDPDLPDQDERGSGLRDLTRRASVQFGTIAHNGAKRRLSSLPFVPPLRKLD